MFVQNQTMRGYLVLFLLFLGCKGGNNVDSRPHNDTILNSADFVIAFGSCNKVELENRLWDDIDGLDPDLFIWGGDNIYADTDDMEAMALMYREQQEVPAYAALIADTPILGTWDDHDYGLNDGGVEFTAKAGSQENLLDFLGVAKNDPRRGREGVYHAQDVSGGKIKILVLDTRYFRSQLEPSRKIGVRYIPNTKETATILGEAQWAWLRDQLKNSTADYNLIVSSIQFLSREHGFEKWANFPREVERMEKLLRETQPKNTIFLSGDRHISEFSRKQLPNLDYPIVDFTSSGLTHAYLTYSGEPNANRVGEVIHTESFGALFFDFKESKVTMRIMGDDGTVLQELVMDY